MIAGKKVLAVITARGGSKRLPGKNVADLQGRPMIAWSVLAARGSRYLDRTILSSEDEEIIAAAEAAGCEVPFRRPMELAGDDSPTSDALLHALDAIGEPFDYLVLLQATSPLRTSEDIDACIELAHRTTGSAIAVTDCKPAEWMVHVDDQGGMSPVLRQQDTPRNDGPQQPSYIVNGAVYVAKVEEFRRTKSLKNELTRAYVMPRERSIDIDTALDLLFARAVADESDILRHLETQAAARSQQKA